MNANDMNDKPRLDLEAIRSKLSGTSGKRYWRSLEEVAELPEFQTWMDDEFPNRSTILQINRRDLLKFMGASMALAGMTGCRSVFLPEDKVVPYVKQPEELVPGKALFYATSIPLSGYATGVLVEQHEGRPTMINGNPDHPASLGAADSITQAQLLSVYDPDRADNVLQKGDVSTIETFTEALHTELEKAALVHGEGLTILTGSITSPTLLEQIHSLLAKYPSASWHAYEPTGRANVFAGAKLAFGAPLEPVYDFSAASVIVSLDADFLNAVENPGSLRYARDFAAKRRVKGKSGTMNRLYAAESTPGLVGAMADHRYPLKASAVYDFATSLAEKLGVAGVTASGADPVADTPAIVRDLQANVGTSLVLAGKHQPPEVHALAFAINQKLGAIGKTVKFVSPIDGTVTGAEDFASLVKALRAKTVKQLIIIDNNPVYTAPADYDFAGLLDSVPFKVQVTQSEDETSKLMDWVIPQTHPLEEWGDARAYDGTVSIAQPLIAPLYTGVAVTEFFARLQGKVVSSYDLLKAHWKSQKLPGEFERNWRQMIHDGVLKGTAATPVVPTLTLAGLNAPPRTSGTEISFRPDPTIYDGRYANNGWLQELPKPISKITWDNVVIVSPKTAQSLSLNNDDVVKLEYKGRSIQSPVFIQPGQPDDSITVHLGYGRTAGGIVATVKDDNGGGFNAYSLVTSDAPAIGSGVTLTKVGDLSTVASTQGHGPLNGDRIIDSRDIIHDWTLSEFITSIDEKLKEQEDKSKEIHDANLYPDEVFEWNGNRWGMTIDMNTCIGCNACVTACQAENNIPVVGKLQVARHREMHWLRIDRYFSGSDENPAVTWQPVACVQCEKAPCEPVCPVAATVHSHEGLNQMVYNRCVGTRYCSNNCPYKVRRFNYLNYSDNQPNFAEFTDQSTFGNRVIPGPIHVEHKQGIQLLKMLNNPDVTVRGRGIMEKCTYCVQRINEARTEAKKTNTAIQDGDVVTACQQACPTQTIVFGDIADKASQVSQWRSDPRAYLLLEELQTRPRTSHLAKLRNPNPEIKTFPEFSQGA